MPAMRLSEFQSTPPHGRRRPCPAPIRRMGSVSIHASAREATVHIGLHTGGQDGVSIHASAREATPPIIPRLPLFSKFQSTPPHGRRLPTKFTGTKALLSFNPRLRTGGDRPDEQPI